MKKKILAVLLTAAMIGTLAVGCSGGSDEGGSSEGGGGAAEDMTFVVVPKCVHAWFDEVNKGAQKQADLLSEQLGVEVTIDYRAPEAAEVSEQNSVLEQAAATEPTAILIDPVDYDGSADIIEEIQGRDIPVILFDAPSPEGSGLTSVGNDFAEQATIAVDMLIEEMGTSGKVAVMQGAPTAPNHAERYQAHLDALAEYPDIEVIDGGIDNDNVETAQSQAAAVLAANPDLTGYLNCDACGAGVAAAIEEKGMQDQITFVAMDNLIEILAECKRAGNPDMVYKFCSTSKITFSGSGIAALATSLNNLEEIKKQLSIQTIGHDKVNQLRHVRFFKDIHGVVEHMRKHADILRPKFEAVEDIFEHDLGGLDIGTWTKPNGGYFISFDSLPGCAKEIVSMAKKAGVTLTPAGAAFPYGKDPEDRNIRIAPSYPSLQEIEQAAGLFTLCVKLVTVRKMLEQTESGAAAVKEKTDKAAESSEKKG